MFLACDLGQSCLQRLLVIALRGLRVKYWKHNNMDSDQIAWMFIRSYTLQNSQIIMSSSFYHCFMSPKYNLNIPIYIYAY
jgi:hypothetical protein